jgi:hypothetical protein
VADKLSHEDVVPLSELDGFTRQFNTDIDVRTYRRINELVKATGLTKRELFEQAIERLYKAKVR